MARRVMLIVLAALAGCAAPSARSSDAAMPRPVAPSIAAPSPSRPTGSAIEPSGFATIEQVPATSDRATNAPSREGLEQQADWLWRAQGLSIEQARQRMAELLAMGPEYERLSARLRAEEAGNYIDARIVHLPDWAYHLYFKRDPDATLARYTKNPRFKAAQGRYTSAELDALVRPWVARLTAAGILGVYGINPADGVASLSLSATEAEYRDISERAGWGPLPDAIKLGFARSFVIPAVDPRAAPSLRAFANDTKPTMIQPARGLAGGSSSRAGASGGKPMRARVRSPISITKPESALMGRDIWR